MEKIMENTNSKKALGLARAWGAYIKTVAASIVIKQARIDEKIGKSKPDGRELATKC